MKHLFHMFVFLTTMAFFSGCFPEIKAELSVKTSALNRAMRGEQAEIMVCVKGEFVISNANDRISIGLNGVETVRDFALLLADAYSELFNKPEFVKRSGRMSFSLEERTNDWPLLKMSATFPASLARKGVEPASSEDAERISAGHLFDDGRLNAESKDQSDEKLGMPIVCLNLNLEDGRIEHSKSKMASNMAFAEYLGEVLGATKMLETFTKKNEKVEWLARNVSFWGLAPICVQVWRPVSLVVEGDDEKPIFVIGKDVKVDGKSVTDYKAWIRKGDKVSIELAGDEKACLKSVQFFETEDQAKTLMTSIQKVSK